SSCGRAKNTCAVAKDQFTVGQCDPPGYVGKKYPAATIRIGLQNRLSERPRHGIIGRGHPKNTAKGFSNDGKRFCPARHRPNFVRYHNAVVSRISWADLVEGQTRTGLASEGQSILLPLVSERWCPVGRHGKQHLRSRRHCLIARLPPPQHR